MLRDVVEFLQCPHCGSGLGLAGPALRCRRGHAFDVARQGYASLLHGDARAGMGDTPAMVTAREAFLAAGHYRPVAGAVADEVARRAAREPACITEIGAGTGHFLATALERLAAGAGRDPAGLALDVSKHAARRAARAHPRIGAVVCDAWSRLPVRTGTAAAVLVVLAPRNAAEIQRVLHPSGALVLVTPTRRHLHELVEPLGLLSVDERKDARLDEQLGSHLALAGRRECEHPMTLTHEDARHLVTMGPSARHTDEATTAERASLLPEPATVTASFTVSVYRPRDAHPDGAGAGVGDPG